MWHTWAECGGPAPADGPVVNAARRVGVLPVPHAQDVVVDAVAPVHAQVLILALVLAVLPGRDRVLGQHRLQPRRGRRVVQLDAAGLDTGGPLLQGRGLQLMGKEN